MRESKPPTRGLVPMAVPTPLVAYTSVQTLNDVLPAPVATGNGRREERDSQVVLEEEESGYSAQGKDEEDRLARERKEKGERERVDEIASRNSTEVNRRSNGFDSQTLAAALTSDTSADPLNYSPRSSISQGSRLSSISTDLDPTLPNGLELHEEQKVATSGESSMEAFVDMSLSERHGSVSEETRELDEFLSRSSMASNYQVESILYQEFDRTGEGSGEDGGHEGEERPRANSVRAWGCGLRRESSSQCERFC